MVCVTNSQSIKKSRLAFRYPLSVTSKPDKKKVKIKIKCGFIWSETGRSRDSGEGLEEASQNCASVDLLFSCWGKYVTYRMTVVFLHYFDQEKNERIHLSH